MIAKRCYLEMRAPYEKVARKKGVKILFIAESPPDKSPDDKEIPYFYNPLYVKRNGLWCHFAKALKYGDSISKPDFLDRFCSDGFLLIDATYEQINKIEKRSERKRIIMKHSEETIGEVKRLDPAKVFLIGKTIVSKVLFPLLKSYEPIRIPLPFYGNNGKFAKEIESSLRL